MRWSGALPVERFTRACGGVTALIALVVLMGWMLAPGQMARAAAIQLPMVPSTGVSYFFLGILLALHVRPASPLALRIAAWVCGSVVLAVVLGSGVRDQLDGMLGDGPRMTRIPITFLILESLVLIVLSLTEDQRVRKVVAVLGGLNALLGCMSTIGYFYGHPMRPVIGFSAVSLTTSLAMTLVGLGIITSAGTDVQPLRLVLADTVESLLLRTFLPLTLGILFVQGVLRSMILLRADSAIAVVAGLSLLWMITIVLAILQVARTIGQRIETMERERTVARMQDRLKSELLASLSHRIRTPMNSVLGMAGLLQRTTLDAQQREFVEIVRSGSENLLDLLDDILDLSRIEAGQLALQPEPFDLAATLRSTSEIFRHLAGEKGLEFVIEITVDLPNRVVGDAKRLRQVVTNLIGNAVKFTSSGRVTVRGSSTRPAPDRVELSFVVEDTGIGLSLDKRARIFTRFSPVEEGGPRLLGGTGLGLSISHELVQIMQGSLTVESVEGEGSIFELRVSFPLDPAPLEVRPPSPAPAPLPATPARRRLLVVDDNPMNLLVASRMLEVMGHDVDQARSGREALEAVRRRSYPLVLMDCEMPDVDGYEATRRIRSSPPDLPTPPDVPIVALTAHALQGHIQRCLEVGMNDIVTKPVNIETLTRAIARWLPAVASGENPHAGEAAAEYPPLPENPPCAPVLAQRRQMLEETLGPESTRDIMKLYLETLERGLRAMIEAWKDEDPEELGREAHRLKGASLNVGASGLAGLCAALEDHSRNRPVGGPPRQIEALLEEAEMVRRTIDPWT